MPETTPFSVARQQFTELRHQIGGMEPTPRNLVEAIAAAVDAGERLAAMCEAFEIQQTALIPDLAMQAGAASGLKVRLERVQQQLAQVAERVALTTDSQEDPHA